MKPSVSNSGILESDTRYPGARPALRFHAHTTLQAAARIAGEQGLQLIVRWNGTQCVVTTEPLTRVPPHDADHIPAFLRPQAE